MSTELDVSKLSANDVYKLLIGTITPRPIAWVSTVNREGQANLAPFSFFSAICSSPPSLLFCPANHPDGREKDTLSNIRETKQFVVNIVSEALATVMNQTSANYPASVDEFVENKIKKAPSTRVLPPRVADSPASFECELLQIVDLGSGEPGSGHIVIGKIVYAHFADLVYQDGKILIEKLNPVARLGGMNYCPVREVFSLPRPILR